MTSIPSITQMGQWLLLAAVLASSMVRADEVDLRGYGKVTATITPDRSEFVCENEDKADILLGKLLADLFWDAGTAQVVTTPDIQGRKVTVREFQPYGAIIAGRNKNRVVVLGASDAKTLLASAAKEPWIADAATQFAPSKPYPEYLDFFDLRSYKAYTHGLNLVAAIKDRWAFARQFLSGGLTIQHPGFKESPADGVVAWDVFDYEFASAEKEKVLYTQGISTGVWPRWASNQHPDYIAQPSSLSVSSDKVSHYTENPEGYGLTREQRESTSLKFLGDVMRRYTNSPALGGWQFYCGSYFFETCFSRAGIGVHDYSSTGEDGFRHWLQEQGKFSLTDLGTRWYGDANHFKSWDEVMVPEDIYGFFGNLNSDALNLNTHWTWQKADPAATALPASDVPGWIPVQWSPSQARQFLPEGDMFYRVEVDADAWLDKNKGHDVYLSCCVNMQHSKKEIGIWLNGQPLDKPGAAIPFNYGSFAVNLTGQLKPGKNELAFKIPAPGRILGPVFLTTEKPVSYPYLGKNRNAQYVDLLQWQLWVLNDKVAHTLQYARGIDPDRPFIVPIGSSVEAAEGQADACAQYGAGLQMTGREAWYHPWWPRMGFVAGFYGTSEPSGVIKTVDGLDRTLGWILQDGDSSHMLFWDVQNYMEEEKTFGWFTQNQRLLHLFGKYLPQKPEIVILRSSRTAVLAGDIFSGMRWDIGRGELQSAHYDNVYASESMLERGLVDPFPVLFDCGTEIMTPEVIAAIHKYVERGGTFVALHNTGRHSLLEPDVWPISELTGFKVLSVGKKGTISFEKDLPLFKGWEGKQFDGEGTSLDFMDIETAKNAGVSLQSQGPDAVALAKWDDGTVAVGMRKIGKGQVIVLGSTFWRSGKDSSGVWRSQGELESAFFEKLFTDLGVQRNGNASDPGVWTRKVVTKNGLQEWLIAFNSTKDPITATLSFPAADIPDDLWDIVAQKDASFDFQNEQVIIKDVVIPPFGTRIYGMKRASLSGGIATWWGEKTKFWKSAPVSTPNIPTMTAPIPPPAIEFENWNFIADKDNTLADKPEWQQSTFDDAKWLKLKTGPWNDQDDSLRDYKGVGLYRSLPFAMPDSWAGKTISLNLMRSSGPIFFAKGEFYLNGVKVAEFNENTPLRKLKAALPYPLKKEGNVLAVKVTGGRDLCGLSGTFWLQPEMKFDPVTSLDGEWTSVAGNDVTQQKVALPGKTQAKYIMREFTVPAEWKGKNIYLNLKTPTESLDRIMINGQPMLITCADEQFNLARYLKIGASNSLEFWPKLPKDATEASFELTHVEIGCEVK